MSGGSFEPGVCSSADLAEAAVAIGVVKHPERVGKRSGLRPVIYNIVACGKYGDPRVFRKNVSLKKISLRCLWRNEDQ